MTNSSSKKTMQYGWLIVLACALTQAIPAGIALNLPPLFVPFVTEEQGFSLAGFSLIFTIGTVVSAITSPFIGGLYRKVNVKVMYLIGAIISGSSFFLMSLATELWQFYALSGTLQASTAVISSIGVPLLISSWFDESSRGKALGLAFAGTSVGNIFLQQITAAKLEAAGASNTYAFFGLLSIAVSLPIGLLLIKMPKNSSDIVKTKSKDIKENKSENTNSDFGYTLSEAKNIKFFWVFCVALFFLGMYVSALAVQYPAYLKGYLNVDTAVVGNVGSIFALFSMVGNLFGGALFDKLGTTKCLMIASVLAFGSCAALFFASNMPELAYLFAALKGLSIFSYAIGPSYLVGSFFGQKDYGTILGTVQIFFAVGFAAGSSVFGALVGPNNNWSLAWGTVFIFIVICYAALITASIGMNKFNKEKIANLNK